MKKIGIVTLFGYENYGNRLQMYATQQVYKTLGYESEIIKYKLAAPKDPFIIRLKVWLHFIFYLRSNLSVSYQKALRIYKFKRHAKIHYNETRDYINPLALENSYHEKYSFLSVGSDQIWGWFIHPIADFAFLKFAPKEKRIAFAPSFGNSTLDQKYRELFTDGLEGFEDLSVREKSGAELIQSLTHKEATILCDPTMCLSKKEWMNFASPHKKKPKGKYLLTYFLGEPSPKVGVILSSLSTDIEIIDLNNLNSPGYYAVSPSEWVDYILDSVLFLTDSFHGVVFSLILETPFAVYSRTGGESMQTRITHILEQFNMKERFEIINIDEALFNMDFSASKVIIDREKNKADSFLSMSLSKK